ncbi:UPF0158 family protein [Psychrosphaera sp. 1_MG-2023]|uniref:UPF0158 family protein n=1 Tax=Psychrosphaera sp. 1_MG-2023 TaxID=3062643 RepID=UPI0026E295CE|nr:UPF0158 family protein [Psychrosphaera sp. 1_MG-2023]MDO6721506.1 UPF0158 family protein [Psychrosphaera sp. 1_MG-2023]
MIIDLDEIINAVEFVSASHVFDNEAYINRKSGDIIYIGDLIDEPAPSDLNEAGKYLQIPTKRALDLGKRLALDFTALNMPDKSGYILSVFSRSGAYERFKTLLDNRGQTDNWYAYENNKIKVAVIDWCKANSINYT